MKSKDDIDLSDSELAKQLANRTDLDRFKDALIHLIFVATDKHKFEPSACNGCKDAKELSGL